MLCSGAVSLQTKTHLTVLQTVPWSKELLPELPTERLLPGTKASLGPEAAQQDCLSAQRT